MSIRDSIRRAVHCTTRTKTSANFGPTIAKVLGMGADLGRDVVKVTGKTTDTIKGLSGATLGIGALGVLGGTLLDSGLEIGRDATSPYMGTRGYLADKKRNDLFDRARMDEEAASSFAKTIGSEAATGVSSALASMFSTGVGGVENLFNQTSLDRLVKGDPILSAATKAESAMMRSAYEGASKIGPRVMSDPYVARNFLRETLVTGNGPDYATMQGIADAERSINNTNT